MYWGGGNYMCWYLWDQQAWVQQSYHSESWNHECAPVWIICVWAGGSAHRELLAGRRLERDTKYLTPLCSGQEAEPVQGQQFTAAVGQGELVTGREELWEKHLWSTAPLFWLSQSSPSSTNTDMFVHSLLRFLKGAGIGSCIIVVPWESTSAQYFSCKQKLSALKIFPKKYSPELVRIISGHIYRNLNGI